MQTITAQERQTLLDIAIKYCGDAEAVFEIMNLNDVSITDVLQTGQTITVPDAYERKTVEYYRTNSVQPATAYIATVESNAIKTNDNNNDLITNDNNDLITENNG
jgi:hypothetical protein